MIITETGARLPTVTDDAILGFFGDYRYLSNFHICTQPIVHDGIDYDSSESAYMAAKTHDRSIKLYMSTLSPGKAKKAGQEIELREDWEDVKIDIMHEILMLKFKDPELRKKLLSTGTKRLEETNSWKDRFWGVCDGEGLNMLGQLLMLVREAI